MNRVLLDTNAYIAVIAGHSEAREIVDRAWSVAFNSVVVGELLAGFALGTSDEQNRRELAGFLRATEVEVLPVSLATAERYGRICKTLRAIGRPIPQNDMWIAVSALEHSLGLFTYDSHFAGIPDL